MKTTITLILTIICISVAAAQEPEGWDKRIVHSKDERALTKLPSIKVISSNKEHIEVKVSNNTGFDLSYYGYSPQSPQLFFKNLVEGKWVAGGWHWCGTGLSRHVLKNGSSVTIKLSTRKNSQVFTIFHNSTNSKEYSFAKLYESKSG